MIRAVGIFVLMLIVGSAQANDAQQVLEKVRRKYESIRDAELKFSQCVKFEMSKTEQKVSGTLSIKKKNKYRVEVDGATIVTDGVTVWSHATGSNQVLINAFKLDESALTPEKILSTAPEDYKATLGGIERIGKMETQVLKLVPTDEASMVQRMTMWIDTATWLMKKVEIVDVNDKTTEYVVNDLKINSGIPDARFTYQIPKGAEAVDLR